MRAWIGITAAGLVLLLLPATARAHMPATSFNAFFGGLLHPLSAFENALPIFTLGLWASRLGDEAPVLLVAVFLVLLAGAGLVAAAEPGLPAAGVGIPVCLMLLGSLVALDLRVPLVPASFLAGGAGLVIGYELWRDLPREWSPGEYAAGLIAGSVLLFATAAGIESRLTRPWMRVVPRVVGSWVAAAGLMLLAVSRSG